MGGVREGDEVGGDSVSPPELPGDAPGAGTAQPLVPRGLVDLGDDTKITITYSLEIQGEKNIKYKNTETYIPTFMNTGTIKTIEVPLLRGFIHQGGVCVGSG